MKKNPYVIALFFICCLSLACNKEDFPYENAFKKSQQEWLAFKESSGNSYRYTVTGGTWAGSGWQTVLTVENGEVTRRNFQYTMFNNIAVPPGGWSEQRAQEILDSLIAAGQEHLETVSVQELVAGISWTEVASEIGSHDPGPAAIARTLDEVYEKARSEWLVKREGVKTYFDARNNGLISSCGYVPDGCQDDCFSGITIAAVEKL